MMRRLLWVCVLLLGGTDVAWAQSCTVSGTTMDFGQLPGAPIPQTAVAPSLTLSCTGTPNATVRACINLNAGTGTGSTLTDRRMSSATDFVSYQVYSDAARTIAWGDGSNAGAVEVSVTLNGSGSGSTVRPMYGLIANPPAQTKSVGDYASTLTLNGRLPNGNSPCGSNSSGTLIPASTFVAKVKIMPSCSVIASDINFGTVASLASPVSATGSLSITCTQATNYTIAMNGGSVTGSITGRKMGVGAVAPGVVSYQLYQDASFATLWGDGVSGGSTRAGSSTGLPQTLSVYARIPGQTTPAAGTYQDNVTVTLTY